MDSNIYCFALSAISHEKKIAKINGDDRGLLVFRQLDVGR